MDKIDLVLIMSVEPGFGGQKFMPEVLPKLKELKKIIDQEKYNVDLEIDGGINFQNSKAAKEAGANILVSGSTCLMVRQLKKKPILIWLDPYLNRNKNGQQYWQTWQDQKSEFRD